MTAAQGMHAIVGLTRRAGLEKIVVEKAMRLCVLRVPCSFGVRPEKRNVFMRDEGRPDVDLSRYNRRVQLSVYA